MTPGARVQAAIEILDQVITAAREGGAAADTLAQRYFATRRYAGSKDRRAVRELLYDAIRRAGELPASGRAAMLGLTEDRPDIAALFDGEPHAPAPIGQDETPAPAGTAPGWLADRLTQSGVDAATQAALLGRAPLDIRVNRLKASRDDVMAAWPDAEPLPHAPDGLRLPTGAAIENSAEYAQGLVEVQDHGSQLVSLAAAVSPGANVIDLCAGGGGKTLALAAAMEDHGHIIATDTDRGRLQRLPPRAGRAGVSIVETRLLDPGREAAALGDVVGAADLVLIDAPCSGTGTWRRNPEARWRLTPERLARLVALQARLLDLGASLVRPGGTLTYIVCSLLDEEGADRIADFLSRHDGWKAETIDLAVGTPRGAGLRLDPYRDSTDGFFVAKLGRSC
ncbi:RsmB/NOP family class I SAM-dependent RNA methyltransferase [Sphingomonas gilva]|uniref:RsmB/NOP family class I SAM-dependent RNA methyltransferase n=1 Tax=Sphingomonas gilva TaxID=2305907 RepID=A0A396RLE4_9SPHN|nr:RsmB/NOP family class I SAM-dependent RNA methyltransferase [Sphingomonas gilva]RHW16396.1 RsmB/NOP family class I SAM-dependent RNA methyltransferase [Sphingomonas gilva]